MKNNNRNIIFFIVILVILGCVYFYWTNSSKPKQTNNTISSTTSGEPMVTAENSTKNDTLNYSGTIYFTKIADNIYEIYSKKNSDDAKLIFTDKDEKEKIKFAPSMSKDGKILAILAPSDQSFGGTLYSINSDGSGQKTKLIDNFITSQAPAISPDGTKIAYILFSNAEFDYGFSLYVANTDGTNKIKIDSDPTTISNFTFNADSNALIYLKGKNINVTNIDGKNNLNIYSLSDDEKLTSITNTINNTDILLTFETKIVSLNKETQKNNNIYTSKDQKITSAYYTSNDENMVAFVNDGTKSLNITDLKDNSKQITEASNIIQWIK